MLQGMDNIESNCLKTLIAVYDEDRSEKLSLEREITNEYKHSIANPNRIVAQMELRSCMRKKKAGSPN